MGLPEVGTDVIDTEVTGATVTMGAPVKGMDEVDGNIGALEGSAIRLRFQVKKV